MGYAFIDHKEQKALNWLTNPKIKNVVRGVGTIINYAFPPELIPDYYEAGSFINTTTGLAEELFTVRWFINELDPKQEPRAFVELRIVANNKFIEKINASAFWGDRTVVGSTALAPSFYLNGTNLTKTKTVDFKKARMFEPLSGSEIYEMFDTTEITKINKAWRPIAVLYENMYKGMQKSHGLNLVCPYTVAQWDIYGKELSADVR